MKNYKPSKRDAEMDALRQELKNKEILHKAEVDGLGSELQILQGECIELKNIIVVISGFLKYENVKWSPPSELGERFPDLARRIQKLYDDDEKRKSKENET